jgi:deoxyribodipyrimidine photo-lyase
MERIERHGPQTGKIDPLTCHRVGYPQPIVDHSQQQRLFKDLYASVKGG